MQRNNICRHGCIPYTGSRRNHRPGISKGWILQIFLGSSFDFIIFSAGFALQCLSEKSLRHAVSRKRRSTCMSRRITKYLARRAHKSLKAITSINLRHGRCQVGRKRFLQPEDENEVGSEIYYFVDRDGNIHSREFLSEDRSLRRIGPS
jgi:hypothetical protein